VALETLKTEIKSATSSMTAVPKPLKFLRPHYDLLKSVYEKLPEGDNKVRLSLSLVPWPCVQPARSCIPFSNSLLKFYTHFCRNDLLIERCLCISLLLRNRWPTSSRSLP
jgi:hypothetical protein